MYFYFKSKQDLFFYTYDEICNEYLEYLKNFEALKDSNSVKEMLHRLLKAKLQYFTQDISKLKFTFRYHLFPPEEIATEIRDKYRFYMNEENWIILDNINRIKSNDFKNIDLEEFLFNYKRLENHFVYEMITSNIKINDKSVDRILDIFWSMYE